MLPKIIKIKSYIDIPKNHTGIVEYPNGTKIYYLNGLWHREAGPAIEYSYGTRCYCLNNKFLVTIKL